MSLSLHDRIHRAMGAQEIENIKTRHAYLHAKSHSYAHASAHESTRSSLI